MGTVEKIVDTLNKMCMDKKSQATHRYEEHSAWLSSEFKNIRSLINIQKQVVGESDDVPECRQKRKSPETCSNGSRNSPQAKRNSSNFADIAIAEGLPPDLNRLKKEDLLEALESRGNCTMTMKALKKDIIDALKDLLLDIHSRPAAQAEERNSLVSSIQEDSSITQPSDSVQNSVATLELNPHRLSSGGFSGAASPARKMSVLAEARQQVNVARQSVLQDNAESSADRSDRLAKEYEARKQRHRSSQIRLSQAMGTAGEGDTGNRSRLSSTDTNHPVGGAADAAGVELVIDETSGELGVENVVLVCGEVTAPIAGDDHDQHDETWNEVPSPNRDVTEVGVDQLLVTSVSLVTKEGASTTQSLLVSDSSSRKSPVIHSGREHAKTLPLVGSPSMVSEEDNSCGQIRSVETQSSVHTSVSDLDLSAAPPSSSGISHIKKLTNLIGGTQTSFLGGNSSSNTSFSSTQSKLTNKAQVRIF